MEEAALCLGPADLLNDLNTMGFLFETLCVRDLRVFAEALGGQSLIEEGAKSLRKLADRIDTTKMKTPSFKMVLTAVGEYAYRRPEDDVYVVPIGCLRS